MKKPYSPQSAGGKAAGIKQRKAAIDNYYKNPNRCLLCRKTIEVRHLQKVAEVRKKKFCNQKCSAIYNNEKFPKRKKAKRFCKKCNSLISPKVKSYSIYCPACRKVKTDRIANRTKGDTNSRRKISINAKSVMQGLKKPTICAICSYSLHVQICHLKAVNKFPLTAKISEINNPNNLIYLCPNCHWELDHGLLFGGGKGI